MNNNNVGYSPIKNLRDRNKSFGNAIENLAKKKNSIIEYACVGVLIAVLAMLAYYIIFPSVGYCTSDTIDTLMWAQATLDSSNGIFNTDFHYAALSPFGGYLFMLPYVAIFGFNAKAQICGMMSFFVFFCFALIIMLKKLNCNLKWCSVITSLTLLTLSLSSKLKEIFWEHIIHYSLELAYSFIGLVLLFTAIDALKSKEHKKKLTICIVSLFMWCCLSATNRTESLIIFLLPLFAAVILERLVNKEKTCNSYTYYGNALIIVSIVVGTTCGYLLGNLLTADVFAQYENEVATFSAMSSWGDNLAKFYLHWTTLLGVEVLGGQEMVSANSIADLLRLCVSMIILIAPFIWIFNYKKIKDRKLRIFVLFHWFSTALIMLGYITGRLSVANWRLSTIVGTSVILVGLGIREMWQDSYLRRFAAVFSVPIIIVLSIVSAEIISLPPDTGRKSGNYKIANELANFENIHGIELKYGYATFWNSNVLTFINEDLPVRVIGLSEETYYKRNYQTNDNWYIDQPDVEKYFVLVTNTEYDMMKENKNELLYVDSLCDRFEICDGQYYVLIYDENLF